MTRKPGDLPAVPCFNLPVLGCEDRKERLMSRLTSSQDLASPRPSAQAASEMSLKLQIGGALLLGILIVAGTGFVQIPAAHSAAHDTRHSLAFPCH